MIRRNIKPNTIKPEIKTEKRRSLLLSSTMASTKRRFAEEDNSHLLSKKVRESAPESDVSASTLHVILNPADCDLGINYRFPFNHSCV